MHTWLHVIDWRADSDADAVAVDDGDARLTYRQLKDGIDTAAGGWNALDVQSEDVVAVLARNSAEWLVQTLGLARLGALPLLLNWRMPYREVEQLLDIATPTGVFVDEHTLPLVGDYPGLIRVVDGPARDGWASAHSLRGPAAPQRPDRLRSDQTAFLMHTSGTTGLPKLIPLDHGSLIRSLAAFAIDIGDQRRGSRHLVMMPLFHLAGFAQAMQCFLTGGTLFIHDGFDVDRAIDSVARDGINFFTAAPTIIETFVRRLEGERAGTDMSSLREIQYGSAPIDSALLERALRSVCGRFRQIYGSTELQGFLTTLRPEDHVPGSSRIASAGRVSAGWEIRIVDQSGADVPPGRSGELLARGECLVQGYWRNEADTRSAFTDDGWYRTGDVALLDDDRFVHIVGRTKDMIVSGGENIYPAEIERALLEHRAVLDVAVVGMSDAVWGEKAVAFVVGADDHVPTTAELEKHCRQRLAGFKCPREYVLVTELPRNTLGKVMKQHLRSRLEPATP